MKVVTLVSRYTAWEEYGVILSVVVDKADDSFNICEAGDVVGGDMAVSSGSQTVLQPTLLDGIVFGDADVVEEAEGGETDLVSSEVKLR